MDFFLNIYNSSEMASKFLLASLFGSMLFFSVIIAPSVFKVLDEKNARAFLRLVFPKLYLWGIFFSLFIIFFILQSSLINQIIAIIILVGFVFSRQVLTIKINDISDKMKTDKSLIKKFNYLHNTSVAIFLVQLVLLIFLFFSV
ncbi:MAG: hypothetical protein CMM91_03220 [Rickettsiales bacterium]|nr:hypothetical protein [Rickettsiales bacterium]OUV54069.1 MAG: hypothetical protein CBC87_01965 [Rickettsiales bacterium TMED127]|tara:strand:+ start:16019 stop:16450 length:432 start_codon:yes stop_codon:yes gene_type:complete